MPFTREQLEYLKDVERMAALRDLQHSYGWEVYSHLAHERIDQMQRLFTREGLNKDEAWEAHVRLRAINQFQEQMDDLVREAVNFVDPMSIELALYSLNQPPEL